jgi:site-specific recombinase XerD
MTPQRQIAKAKDARALVRVNHGALDRNAAAVYIAGLAPGSRRTMRDALNEIAGLLTVGKTHDALLIEWGAVRFQHAAAVRSKLAETQSAATVNKKLSALRGVLRAAFQLEQMSAEDYTRASAVKAVTGETVPAGRALAAGEIEALFSACAKDQDAGGARDGAVIALMRMGLRRAEVCALDLKDYNPQDGALRVKGKRNKVRVVYIKNGAARWLADWLNARGNAPGALFCQVLKSGKIVPGRIVPQTIFDLLKRRAKQAGVKDISPHDFRRTFVGDLLDAGADIVTVKNLAGHESTDTTARYDRRGEIAKQKATELLHVPYFGRG